MRRQIQRTAAIAALLVGGAHALAAAEFCVSCTGPEAVYLCRIAGNNNTLRGTAGQFHCITQLANKGSHDACSVTRQSNVMCEGLAETVLQPPANAGVLPFTGTKPEPAAQSDLPADGADRPAIAPDAPQPIMTPALKQPSDFNQAGDTEAPVGHYGSDTDSAGQTVGEIENPPPQPPPKTVEEMAKRTFQSSKKGLDKAGKAVSKTTKSATDAVSNAAKATGNQIGKTGKTVGSAAKKTWNCVTSLFSDC